MTVKEIVEKYLRDNEYDGLCCPDAPCCCAIDSLMILNRPLCFNCKPGVRDEAGNIVPKEEKP